MQMRDEWDLADDRNKFLKEEHGLRITTTDEYFHRNCFLEPCKRQYCTKDRLLWRDCETVEIGTDDSYANGRGHIVYDLGDCPKCKKRYEDRAFEQMIEKRKLEASNGK